MLVNPSFPARTVPPVHFLRQGQSGHTGQVRQSRANRTAAPDAARRYGPRHPLCRVDSELASDKIEGIMTALQKDLAKLVPNAHYLDPSGSQCSRVARRMPVRSNLVKRSPHRRRPHQQGFQRCTTLIRQGDTAGGLPLDQSPDQSVAR
jgi:hypothetical protein